MAKAPKFTLKPGQKLDLKIKKAKIKAAELKKIQSELNNLSAVNQSLKSSKTSSKILQKKIADLKVSIEQEIRKQTDLINQMTLAPLMPYVKVIQKECSQAIAVYKQVNNVLFRGSRNAPIAYKGRSWEQRKTRDSDPRGQELFDAALTKMGITAIRSNSIFTTGSQSQADTYGEIYMIFPKNGFQFSWSRFDPDIVIDGPWELMNEKVIEKLRSDIDKFLTKKDPNRKDFFDLDYWIDVKGFDNTVTELKRIGYPKAELITKENIVDVAAVKRDYGPTNKNLAAAIQAGGEVLISGEYYAFSYEQFNGLLSLLGIEYNDIDT